MAKHRDIFVKLRLSPGQLRSVAERRFGDAVCLLRANQQERANGAIYLAGIVIECLLKAALLDRHPYLERPVDPAKLSESDRAVQSLLYSHELEDMLGFLPEVQKKLMLERTRSGLNAWVQLRVICEEWTIYARYSPAMAKLDRARTYIETVDEVRKCLKQL